MRALVIGRGSYLTEVDLDWLVLSRVQFDRAIRGYASSISSAESIADRFCAECDGASSKLKAVPAELPPC